MGPSQTSPLPRGPRAQPQPLAWWVGGCSLQADLSFLGSAGAWPAWSVTPSRGGGVWCGRPMPRTCFGTLPAQGPLLFASTQSCLTSALQIPAIRRGPKSARTSWATSTANAETAGQGDFVTEVRLHYRGRWGCRELLRATQGPGLAGLGSGPPLPLLPGDTATAACLAATGVRRR